MFAGEPFSSARETGLHFIGNEENSMLAANFLQQGEIIFWRDYEAAFAQDWFGDDRGHRLRRNAALECVFEVMREGFRGGAFFSAIGICKRDAIDIAGEGLKAGFVGMRFAGERHGQQGAAMKGIFKANYRWALGVSARDFDGILDGFRASVDDDGFLGSFAGR